MASATKKRKMRHPHIVRAWVAQLVEHQTFNLRAQGSSPCPGIKKKKKKISFKKGEKLTQSSFKLKIMR